SLQAMLNRILHHGLQHESRHEVMLYSRLDSARVVQPVFEPDLFNLKIYLGHLHLFADGRIIVVAVIYAEPEEVSKRNRHFPRLSSIGNGKICYRIKRIVEEVWIDFRMQCLEFGLGLEFTELREFEFLLIKFALTFEIEVAHGNVYEPDRATIIETEEHRVLQCPGR